MTDQSDPDFVNRFELETWSRCAQGYLAGFAGMTSEAFPFLIEAASISKGDKVLDVGSGPGHICGALRDIGCQPSGIDFSGSMVKVANENYPGIAFEEGNAEDLPYEDESFDAVISNYVVHHLARPERVFMEVSRVLKSGGKFAYSVFADPESQSSVGAFFAAVDEHHSLDELPHGPLFGVTDLDLHREMLEAGGLADPTFEFRDFVWRAETPLPIWDSFRVWGNIDSLPSETAEKIKRSTFENLKPYGSEQGFAFPHTVLVGNAVKR